METGNSNGLDRPVVPV